MTKRTPKSIASELVKLDKRIVKAAKTLRDAESYLAYIRADHAELPARLAEARNEVQAASSEHTAALAELTKPLDSYAWDANWRTRRQEWGVRRYASPAAQRAYDTARAEHYARERMERLETDSAMTEAEYTADHAAAVEAARAVLQNLNTLRNGLLSQYAAIMGSEPSHAQYHAMASKNKTTAPVADAIELTARAVEDGYIVMAESLIAAFSKVKEFSLNGLLYYADHVTKWARLEKGNQIKVTVDPDLGMIVFRSPDSRMTIKSQGDRTAPVVSFATY